jgi:nitrogenase molybdenum-iron protein alpha/beta subunit
MNRLSDVTSNQGVKFSHDAACPGSHCPMHTALATAKNLKGLSTLVIGMAECGYYSRFVMETPKGKNGELHYVYEMDSNEVVFGCREGLIQALRQMSKEGAKTILMIMTCIPALIGEDPKSVIEELSGQIDSKLMFFDGAHFKRNGYFAGFYETFGVLSQIMDSSHTEQPVQRNMVQIFGTDGEEIAKLKEQLVKYNYQVRQYDISLSIDDLAEMKYAKLSIVTSKKMYRLAKELWELYKIPYVSLYAFYEANELKEQYLEIFQRLNIIPDESFSNYLEKQVEDLNTLENQIPSWSYFMNHSEYDAISLSVYLTKLGMKPVLLHIEEIVPEDMEYKKQLLDLGVDPYVTYVTNDMDMSDYFQENKVDFVFGNCGEMEYTKKISGKYVYDITNLCGFLRSKELLKQIIGEEEGA